MRLKLVQPDAVLVARKALRAEGDSEIENLLINRILSVWLMTTHADESYAAWLHRGGTSKEGEYRQTCLERAQRQLVRAIQALVRKLIGSAQPVVRPENVLGDDFEGAYLAMQRRTG